MYFPHVIEKTGRSEKPIDLPSRLLQDRIVYLADEVNEMSANAIVMQFLWLSAEDPEKDIDFYINSPGGIITEGMAMYDIIQHIPNKVNTITVGQASSMGAFLLSTGTGTRKAMKHSRIMIHQPLGGAQGQATDIMITAKEIDRMKNELCQIMSERTCGKTSFETLMKKMDRDYFMDAEEALKLGLIDKIL